jgi:hypothetical protein
VTVAPTGSATTWGARSSPAASGSSWRSAPIGLHIDSRGGTEPHRLTEAAVTEDGRITYPAQASRLDL